MHIYDELKAAGVPLDSHESDLYAKATPAAQAIIDRWEHRANVRPFISQIDGSRWLDLPFAYKPFWDRKARRATP